MALNDVKEIAIPGVNSPYRKLEYISFSGTEYILTNDIPTNHLFYFLDFSLSSIVNDKFLFAANGNSNSDGVFRITVRTSTTAAQSRFGRNSSTNNDIATVSTNTKYQLKLRLYDDYRAWFGLFNSSGTQLGTQYYSPGITYAPAAMVPFAIMGYNNGGTVGNMTAGKVYRYFRKDGGDNDPIVADYYPCQRKSDNVCGLYDIISCTFLPMTGTNITTSAAGPTVEENPNWNVVTKIADSNGDIIWANIGKFPYRRLEYLNMKNAWIDTGVKPTKAYYFCNCKFPSSYAGAWGMVYGAEGYINNAAARLWMAMKETNGGLLFSRVKAVADTTMVNLSALDTTHQYQLAIRTYATNNTSGTWWFAIYDRNTGGTVYSQYYNNSNYAMNMTNFNTIGINVATRQNAGGNFYAQEGNSDFQLFRFFNTSDTASDPKVHDMYPCQRKVDGLCGVYDTITQKFIPCWGTAAYTCGGPVVDEYWDLTTPS